MLHHHCNTLRRWLSAQYQQLRRQLSNNGLVVEHWQLEARPPLSQLATMPPTALPLFVQESTIARYYLNWLGALAWEELPERSIVMESGVHWRGPSPQSVAPYVAAFLVKVDRQLPHMEDLRQCLIDHPALPWIFGFPLKASAAYSWGFDVEASLPVHRHFNRVLRKLPNSTLQFLLGNTVTLLQELLPPNILLGDEISLDTKHIIAWVKENNPKVHIKGGRYHKTHQPKGDPDCRLGFKANQNQLPPRSAATPTTEGIPGSQARPGDYYWGYASGLVATKIPGWAEIALAELTLPFNHSDLSYFFPLMRQVAQRLGRRPRFGALDAGFDAFYVYAHFHHAKGFAAVPLRQPDQTRSFDPTGLPLCLAGLAMPLKSTYIDRTHLIHHQRGRYACPLFFPTPTGQPCPIDDPHWHKNGCLTTMSTSIGARVRHHIDRQCHAFKQLYRQRTATERVFSQAFELGIERPKLRNRFSIANRNTLIYITINLRTYQRLRQKQERSA